LKRVAFAGMSLEARTWYGNEEVFMVKRLSFAKEENCFVKKADSFSEQNV
jgi:hypothetical protein